MPWDPATDAKLRAILTELVKPGAPPAITGIANGLHVPGTLPGESESQLFLNTASDAHYEVSEAGFAAIRDSALALLTKF